MKIPKHIENNWKTFQVFADIIRHMTSMGFSLGVQQRDNELAMELAIGFRALSRKNKIIKMQLENGEYPEAIDEYAETLLGQIASQICEGKHMMWLNNAGMLHFCTDHSKDEALKMIEISKAYTSKAAASIKST